MSIEQARKIRNRYRPILDRARWNSTLGKSKDASIIYMKKITEYWQALKDIGFRITDESEPGRAGRLVPITEEWRQAQFAKMTEVDRLLYEAHKAKPEEGAALIREAIKRMAQGEE